MLQHVTTQILPFNCYIEGRRGYFNTIKYVHNSIKNQKIQMIQRRKFFFFNWRFVWVVEDTVHRRHTFLKNERKTKQNRDRSTYQLCLNN